MSPLNLRETILSYFPNKNEAIHLADLECRLSGYSKMLHAHPHILQDSIFSLLVEDRLELDNKFLKLKNITVPIKS